METSVIRTEVWYWKPYDFIFTIDRSEGKPGDASACFVIKDENRGTIVFLGMDEIVFECEYIGEL